jgi:hypothetical protein
MCTIVVVVVPLLRCYNTIPMKDASRTSSQKMTRRSFWTAFQNLEELGRGRALERLEVKKRRHLILNP